MNVIWSENDCDAICKFIDEVLVGCVSIITERRSGATVNVLVGGWANDGNNDGLLTLFGQQLDANFDLTQPRRHVWIEWDDIDTLEVH